MAQPRSANPSFFLSIAKCVAVAPPTMSSEHVNSAWVVYRSLGSREHAHTGRWNGRAAEAAAADTAGTDGTALYMR